jgi:hypothetical protein
MSDSAIDSEGLKKNRHVHPHGVYIFQKGAYSKQIIK